MPYLHKGELLTYPCGSFTSVEDLTTRVLAFIDHYNRTVRPFKWTYQGTVLAA